MNIKHFIVNPNTDCKLKNYDCEFTGDFKSKEEAQLKLNQDITKLGEYQEVLYAQNTYALLVIFQAMDAAGKDSTIKHVMSGINPQGCQVFSFKAPSSEELDHDYLWRINKCLPERGRIGIFNRSYYEEVLITRVHPEIFSLQQLPEDNLGDGIWERRFAEINNFEKYLVNNGIIVIKFFLNVSKEEQKKRFLDRINEEDKHWKFSVTDVQERQYWNGYMAAYQDIFKHTSTEWAPWYIIPADKKWFTRLAVADILCQNLAKLDLKYPKMKKEHLAELMKAKQFLESED